MTFCRITLGEMRRRPGRALLTFLGIVIGVASIVATTMTTKATGRSYREMFEAVTGRAALEVVAEAHAGFQEADLDHIIRHPGISASVPVIQVTAAVMGRSGAVPVLVLGIDPVRDRAARDYQFHAGQFLDGEPGVLVEEEFARAHGLELGQPIRLLTPTGVVWPRVVGLLEPRGAATFHSGAIVITRLEHAQRWFALHGQINSLQLVLADRVDARLLERDLANRLPAGLRVQAPGTRGQQARQALYTADQALVGLSLVSVVAGAFVIFNSFMMNLGERRRQLATLRALGATRAQVIRLLLGEAAWMGVAGTAVGAPTGVLLASGLRLLMGQLLGTAPPELHWSLEPFLLAVVFGPGMALAATCMPARRASRSAPLADLLGHGSGVERVDCLNWIPLRVQGVHCIVVACTLPPTQSVPIALVQGEPAQVRAGLQQGGIVLGMALAKRLGAEVGSVVAIETRQGPESLQVVGTANEYTLDGMALVMEWATARRLFAVQGVHVIAVTAKVRGDRAVAEQLEAFAATHGLIIQSQAALRGQIDGQLRNLTVCLWGLLALLAVVASLGIVNTLTINILEQTRDLGVLRASGMSRGQVRRMILGQALAIALVSIMPGILAGVALAYFCTMLERHVLAHHMAFHFYAGYAAYCVLAAVLLALLAALFPARRAANLQVIQALRYE